MNEVPKIGVVRIALAGDLFACLTAPYTSKNTSHYTNLAFMRPSAILSVTFERNKAITRNTQT